MALKKPNKFLNEDVSHLLVLVFWFLSFITKNYFSILY